MDQKDTKILNADNIAKYWWIIDYLVSKTIKRRSLFSWVPTTCVFLKIRENALILYGHNSLFIVKKNKIKHYLFSFLCLKLCLHWFMPFLFIFNRSLLVILNMRAAITFHLAHLPSIVGVFKYSRSFAMQKRPVT